MTRTKRTSRLSKKPTTPADTQDGEEPAETPTQVETAASPPPPVQHKFVLKEQTIKYDLDTLISTMTNRPIKDGEKPAKPLVFWCDICSVMLSPSMAAISHFNGKGHLAQLNQSKQKAKTKGPVKGPVKGPGAVENGKESLKRPHPEGTSMSRSEPAQKVTKTEKVTKIDVDDPGLKCNDCIISFPNYKVAADHFKSKRHLKTVTDKMDSIKYDKLKQQMGAGESLIKCDDCKVVLPDYRTVMQHFEGNRHLRMKRRQNQHLKTVTDETERIKYFKLKEQLGAGEGHLKCDDCKALLPDYKTAMEHFEGNKHLRMMEEKMIRQQNSSFERPWSGAPGGGGDHSAGNNHNTHSNNNSNKNGNFNQPTGFSDLRNQPGGFGGVNNQSTGFGGIETQSTEYSDYGGLNTKSTAFGNQSTDFDSINNQSTNYSGLNSSDDYDSLNKSTSFGSLRGNYDDLDQHRNVSNQSNYSSSLGSLGNNSRW